MFDSVVRLLLAFLSVLAFKLQDNLSRKEQWRVRNGHFRRVERET